MADITMCADHKCPSRERCYRYRAMRSKYQSMFIDTKRNGRKACDHIMSIDPALEEYLTPMDEIERSKELK